MKPFGPLGPVVRVWPRRPAGERKERRQDPGSAPGVPDEERDPATDGPPTERQSGDEKPPVPGRIVDDYA